MVDKPKIPDFSKLKLKSIKESGADLIVTLCPFCHTQYDLNQSIIEEEYSEEYNIPVLHYTQLLGLAQGISFDDLGLYENRVPADEVLAAFE